MRAVRLVPCERWSALSCPNFYPALDPDGNNPLGNKDQVVFVGLVGIRSIRKNVEPNSARERQGKVISRRMNCSRLHFGTVQPRQSSQHRITEQVRVLPSTDHFAAVDQSPCAPYQQTQVGFISSDKVRQGRVSDFRLTRNTCPKSQVHSTPRTCARYYAPTFCADEPPYRLDRKGLCFLSRFHSLFASQYPVSRDSAVGCNNRSALHRTTTFGAMSIPPYARYPTLRVLPCSEHPHEEPSGGPLSPLLRRFSITRKPAKYIEAKGLASISQIGQRFDLSAYALAVGISTTAISGNGSKTILRARPLMLRAAKTCSTAYTVNGAPHPARKNLSQSSAATLPSFHASGLRCPKPAEPEPNRLM